MRRRDVLLALAASAALAQNNTPIPRKGRIKQGVTRGVFGREMSLEDACRAAARLGIKGFDLIGPPDWPILKKYSLVRYMRPSTRLRRKACRISLHFPATAPAWPIRKAPTTASRS